MNRFGARLACAVLFTQISLAANAAVVAEYHFDEASWQGTADEVQDNSGNGFDGVAIGAVTTVDGFVCGGGDFRGTGTDRLSLDANAMDGLQDFSISVWGRTSETSQFQTVVSGANSTIANDVVMLFETTPVFRPVHTAFFNDSATIAISTFNNDVWHHFVWTRDSSLNRNCFYMDNVLQGCVINPDPSDADPLDVDTNGLVIAQDQDSVGGSFEASQAWDGLLDELVIFDQVLSAGEVTQIFNNQSAGENWDGGGARPCTVTTPDPIAAYYFDQAAWDGTSGEVVDSSSNSFNGDAINADTTDGLLCRAADLSASGTGDYLSLPNGVLNGIGNFTIATWIRTSLIGDFAIVSAANTAFTANELIFWFQDNPLWGPFIGGSAVGLGITSFSDGQWHHLAWTRSGANNCLHIDAVFIGCVSLPTFTLAVDPGGLIIGQEQDSLGGGFSSLQAVEGLLDEMLFFNSALGTSQIALIRDNNLNGLSWDGSTRQCPGFGIGAFEIVHDGAGIHCANETIRVRALDSNGDVFTGYAGTVNLDTGSGRGSWTVQSGAGSLVDGTADDGLASYTFAAADNGEVELALSYPQGTPLINIAAVDSVNPAVVDTNTEGNLLFSPSGFTVTASAVSNPPSSPVTDPLQTTVAGTDFSIFLTAFGVTDDDPVCGVIEDYAGARTIDMWQTWVDPTSQLRTATVNGAAVGSSSVSTTQQSVTFVAGQAQLTAKYKDAGRVRLQFADRTVGDVIEGATDSFVSRPALLQISTVETLAGEPNPAATSATGTGFTAAGSVFRVNVDVLDAEGALTPNFGNEAVAESIRLTSPALVLPAAGRHGSDSLGTLGGATAFTASATPGRLTNASVSYDEVGVIQLSAEIADGDYLGAGAVLGNTVPNVGRFFPDRYELRLATIEDGCTAGTPFTYMSAPQLTLQAELEAQNTSGGILQNYDAALLGAGAVAAVDWFAENNNDGINLGARVSVPAASWQLGEYVVNTTSASFDRAAAPDGPFTALEFSVQVLDSLDARVLTGLNRNAVTTGDCLTDGSCLQTLLGSADLYYGRIAALPAIGPEDLNLPVDLEAQVFGGAAFGEHADDVCSTYQGADLTLLSYQGNLTSGETSVLGPGSAVAFLAGHTDPTQPLLLSAPGIGNDGIVTLSVDVPAWLTFDWQGTGQQDPQTTASFGRYRGHDRIVYWRQDP